jgi:plasmid stabilization system protein ParE
VKIRYLAIAREEVREAADYYAAISPRLGRAFRTELRQLMRLVAKMPLAWAVSGEGTRKCLLTHFPYLIIYAPLPGELLVLAVCHQHREPVYWRDRLAALK